MLPFEHFPYSRRPSNVFCPCRNENLLWSLSHNPLCPLSRLESLVRVFSQCRTVDFGPSYPCVTTTSDMTCQQLHSYTNTPYSPKKSDCTSPPDWPPVWSPQPAHQASPCSSPTNHRLCDTHLPSPSCRMANESEARGTPFSQTLVFLSRLVKIEVCVRHLQACADIFFFFLSRMFWASAVLAAQGQLLERIAQLLFLCSIILFFWGESCHFDFCHLDFFLPVLNSVSEPVWVMGMEFSLVILDMFWLHACAMTRLLSVFLCSKSGTQHTHVRCRHCVDVRRSTLKMSDSFVKSASTVDPHTRLLIQMHAVPLSFSSAICFTPIWPRLSICFEIAISEGTVSEAKRGNGLRVELSMWRTWRVFCRGLFSIWTMFSDAEERVWTFGRIFVVLSVCHLLFQPCSFSRKPEAEVQEGTINVKRHTALFKAYKTLMNIWDVVLNATQRGSVHDHLESNTVFNILSFDVLHFWSLRHKGSPFLSPSPKFRTAHENRDPEQSNQGVFSVRPNCSMFLTGQVHHLTSIQLSMCFPDWRKKVQNEREVKTAVSLGKIHSICWCLWLINPIDCKRFDTEYVKFHISKLGIVWEKK